MPVFDGDRALPAKPTPDAHLETRLKYLAATAAGWMSLETGAAAECWFPDRPKKRSPALGRASIIAM
jgi:hypothetical protein